MKPNFPHRRSKPVQIKRGNVCVKISSVKNRVADADYFHHTLVYYSGSKRVKKGFSDLDLAKREAEITATKLANGEHDVLKLTSTDRAVYQESVELLRPLGRLLNAAVSD